MKACFVSVTASVLVGAAALAQLRITSFNPGGEIAWTNSVFRGVYRVEWADCAAGPWHALAGVADLDWAKTNRITAQASLSSPFAFYRVAWIPPDPIGVWDYRGYDNQGTLVITGQLNVASITVLSTNPDNPVYGVQGAWDLQYAGPPTNEVHYLGHQIGTGALGGTLDSAYASLTLRWPTDVQDDNMFLSRDLWANTYTGMWLYITFGPVGAGTFTATRTPSTNAIRRGFLIPTLEHEHASSAQRRARALDQ